MKNKKNLLNNLSSILGVIGIITSFEVIPFVSKDMSIAIIGFAAALTPLVITLGDYLDNKKLDGSFKG